MTYFRFFPDCHYYPGHVNSAIYDISRKQLIFIRHNETIIINKFLENTTDSVIREFGIEAKEILDKLVNQGFGNIFKGKVFAEKLYSTTNLSLGNLTKGHLELQTFYLQISDKCDGHCTLCQNNSKYIWQGCNSCLNWPSSSNMDLDFHGFFPTLNEILNYKPKKIVFSGGNPLNSWDKLIEIVELLHSKFDHISIQVNTNGKGLNSNIIKDAAKFDIAFCFSIIQDHFNDNKQFYNNIKHCINNDIKYAICLVLTSNDKNKYNELVKYAKQFQSQKIYSTELISKEKINSIISLPTDKNKIQGINSTKYFSHQKAHPCLERSLAIASNGNILPCPMSENILGNIYTKNNLKYSLENDLFDKYWFNTKNNIPICNECEYRWICEDCAILEQASVNNDKFHKVYCNYIPSKGLWLE